MKNVSFAAAFGIVALVSACEELLPGPTAAPAIIITCGLLDVVVDATESDKIKQNFGSGSLVDSVCDLFAPDGSALPADPVAGREITVTLPDGQSATALVVGTGTQ